MSNVVDFGASGDGLCDDTVAILQALEQGDGSLRFPPGDYLITQTVPIELAQTGRMSIEGSGGAAKIIMAGPGPAFHLIGTHTRSADPDTFRPEVWAQERMPTVLNVEIEGRHPEADGFLIEGAMQSTFEGVLLRQLRHGIRIHGRARNVLISHSHIYHNCGIGIFLDDVNLHQIIVASSHISYCKGGGIKIVGSQIRNLQITGNDIEYNFDPDADTSADIWIDVSAERATVREGTISGNTIQASYSPGGANILMLGRSPQINHKVGMVAISGNLIGPQENNIRLIACRGVAISGNIIFSARHRNLLVEDSRTIVVGPNSFDHNPDYNPEHLCTGIRIANSRDCTLSGLILHDPQTEPEAAACNAPDSRCGLLEVERSQRINITGCQILDGYPGVLYLKDTRDVSVTNCTLMETRDEAKVETTVRWEGTGSGNMLTGNRIGKGLESALAIDKTAGVTASGNLVDET